VNGYGPEDTSELVGEGDGGTVVSAALEDGEGPGLEVVGAFDAGSGEQDGARAVDQESAQIRIAALGDGAEMTAQAAGELAGDQAERAGEPSAGSESVQRADEGDQGGGGDQANSRDGEGSRRVGRAGGEPLGVEGHWKGEGGQPVPRPAGA